MQQFGLADSSDAATGNVYLTPGANVTQNAAIVSERLTFKVTRILYCPDENTIKNGREDGLPFAPVSNMEFALKCK